MKQVPFVHILSSVLLFMGCNGVFMVDHGDHESAGNEYLAETPVAVNTQSQFLVTPRWIPDGSGFLVSGRFGIGLYMVTLQGREIKGIDNIDSSYRGPVEWTEDGGAFCLDGPGVRMKYDLAEGKIRTDTTGDCRNKRYIRASSEENDLLEGIHKMGYVQALSEKKDLLEIIHEGDMGKIVHEEHRGGLKILSSGEETIVEGYGAWHVRVSPDEARIAYCTEGRDEATLKVYTIRSAEYIVVRGEHPSWFPDGKHLMYAAPLAETTDQGTREIYASDLYVLDVEHESSARLTETPDVIEMQPAVSPDGSQVLFSDWKSGITYVMSVERRSKP